MLYIYLKIYTAAASSNDMFDFNCKWLWKVRWTAQLQHLSYQDMELAENDVPPGQERKQHGCTGLKIWAQLSSCVSFFQQFSSCVSFLQQLFSCVSFLQHALAGRAIPNGLGITFLLCFFLATIFLLCFLLQHALTGGAFFATNERRSVSRDPKKETENRPSIGLSLNSTLTGWASVWPSLGRQVPMDQDQPLWGASPGWAQWNASAVKQKSATQTGSHIPPTAQPGGVRPR